MAIAKEGLTPDALEECLRRLTRPIIARIERDRVLPDLRTVLADQDSQLPRLLERLQPLGDSGVVLAGYFNRVEPAIGARGLSREDRRYGASVISGFDHTSARPTRYTECC